MPDALSALIEAVGRPDVAKDQKIDLAAELLTFVVGGSDTTSAALAWVLSVLDSFPAFQETLRKEIGVAFAGPAPHVDDPGRVPSLRPFVEETLRMFPVPILSRFDVVANMAAGQRVGPGDRVLVSVTGLHQNPASWEAPRGFRLERHVPDAMGRERRSHFMAFSAGPRICGGARFAHMELAIALIQILRRCRLAMDDPLPLAPEWGASMRRRQKLRVLPVSSSG